MASGTCGKNLTWQFDGDTLTIRGNGDMKNFSVVEPPWSSSLLDILNIVIADDVEEASRLSAILRSLTLKKNPAAKSDADFSTGFLTWLMRRTVEKQISFG